LIASDRLNVRAFGLSAQGGSFETEAERVALKTRKALERAYLVREDGTKTDFDEPVRWAMGID
jgi:hypothetical protein